MINKEGLIEILERPELNKSAIADLMFPNSKFARITLSHKLKESKSGSDTQRKLSENDIKKAWEVLKTLAKDINEKAPTD